jgi:hypothetical protein
MLTWPYIGDLRDAIAPLRRPPHVLPGDHDHKPTHLAALYEILGACRLPYADTIKGHRGLSLDVVCAWPSKGLLDTRSGPNRNGRTW